MSHSSKTNDRAHLGDKVKINSIIGHFDPIKLLKIIGSEDYEQIIQEWASEYLKKKYVRVEKLGGSGDKGRDVVCTYDADKDIWDNYQCKHYDKPLSPNNVWIEIGKLLHYTHIEDYSIPRKYYFVAPCGIGAKLRDFLKKPKILKQELIMNWNKYCKSKITLKGQVILEGDFKNYVEVFNYTIFDYVDPQEFLNQFRETCYFSKRFGTLTKPRPIVEDYPTEIQKMELVYIKKILDAYSDHLGKHIEDSKKIEEFPDLLKHFKRQRYNFYCAESLKAFSREIHDPDLKYFEKLEQEIYDGIIDEIEDDAKTGFERLKKVLKRAEQLTITSNPLISDVEVKDKKGICHHLANEKEDVKWVK